MQRFAPRNLQPFFLSDDPALQYEEYKTSAQYIVSTFYSHITENRHEIVDTMQRFAPKICHDFFFLE